MTNLKLYSLKALMLAFCLNAAFMLLAANGGLFAGGCSEPPKPEVSFSTLEDARARGRENGTMNARRFVAENKLADCDVYARGDSTQAVDCPQGDGWASPELRCKDGRVIKLKCSTVSDALGCMEETDFKTKSYAADDNKCQPTNKVPHPLPKLGQ